MSKIKSTPAAETTATNNANANPLAGKVIPQNSKKAEKLLAQAKAKAESKKEEKASKAPKTPKVPVITMASKLDELIKAGGKWDALVAKANEESKKLGKSLVYNVGTLKAHIRFRTVTQKNPDYLGEYKVTDDGILIVAKKSNKKAA
jgi:hypothetical protein